MAAGRAQEPALRVQLLAEEGTVRRAIGCTGGGHFLTPTPDGMQIVSDLTLNDSDKTLTVDAGELWEIISLFVDFTATATVGNRQLMIDVRDDNNVVVGRYPSVVNITASLQRFVTWAAGIGGTISGLGGNQVASIPVHLWLPAAWDLRIYDRTEVDAAADDLLFSALVRQTTA